MMLAEGRDDRSSPLSLLLCLFSVALLNDPFHSSASLGTSSCYLLLFLMLTILFSFLTLLIDHPPLSDALPLLLSTGFLVAHSAFSPCHSPVHRVPRISFRIAATQREWALHRSFAKSAGWPDSSSQALKNGRKVDRMRRRYGRGGDGRGQQASEKKRRNEHKQKCEKQRFA